MNCTTKRPSSATTLVAIALVTLALPPLLRADSPWEAKLKKLTEQRDKAIEAAVKPIQLQYKIELEKLMRQATKTGDLDAALKIRDLLEAEETKAKPKTAKELAEFLHGTIWNISNGTEDSKVVYTLTFNKNGTFKHSDGRTGKVEYQGPRKFKLWNYDPATLNENMKQFRAKGSATVYFGNLKSR